MTGAVAASGATGGAAGNTTGNTTGGRASDYQRALDELAAVFRAVDEGAVEQTIAALAAAKRIVMFGAGREGLQVRGLVMRLYHLGLRVAMVGEMTTPPVGAGDLFFAVVGPGTLPTANALLRVARAAGARCLVVTAQPDGEAPHLADLVLPIPAQTMATDQEAGQGAGRSILPMGSLFEGALFILFEILVLRLRERLGVTPEAMRANHTNVE